MKATTFAIAILLCVALPTYAQEYRPGAAKRWEGVLEFLAYSEFTARVVTRGKAFCACGLLKTWIEYTLETVPGGVQTKVYVSACPPKERLPIVGLQYRFICRRAKPAEVMLTRKLPDVLIVEEFALSPVAR